MVLDGLTLQVAGSLVAAISALLLAGAWFNMRVAALLWWSAALLSDAIGIAVLAQGLSNDYESVTAIGGALSSLSAALIWAGARSFCGRRQIVALLLAGTILSALVGALASPQTRFETSAAFAFAQWTVYLAAAMFEIWRGREERLAARWPLIAFIGLHAFFYVGGVYDVFMGNLPRGVVPALTSWFSIIHLESLIFAVGAPISMLLLAKERGEQQHIIAAHTDGLTGVMNRRAFLESAERAIARCRHAGSPVAGMMLDLDRFKLINDTFGHSAGDATLRAFTVAARRVLRPNDLFGRLGGEEFAAILPGATVETAYVVAERIRVAFSSDAAVIDGLQLGATVSAGVADSAPVSSTTAGTLLREADDALYRAKQRGRNRVERAESGRHKPGDVIRVA